MIYVIGLLAGLVSGFFATGGGLLLHPAMKRWMKLDEYKARGTTLAVVFPATIVASIFYMMQNENENEIDMTLKIIVGGCIGSFLGAKWMKKIPRIWLAVLFDIFLIIASIKIIIKG